MRTSRIRQVSVALAATAALLAAPVYAADPPGLFADVPFSDPAYQTINRLASTCLFIGFPDCCYSRRALTRYEFAVVVQQTVTSVRLATAGGLETNRTKNPTTAVVRSTPNTLADQVCAVRSPVGEFRRELKMLNVDVDATDATLADLERRAAGLPIGFELLAERQKRVFNLERIKELASGTPAARARLGLQFLREETERPSPPLSAGGDLYTHRHTLASIARAMVAQPLNPASLRDAFRKAPPGELREWLAVLVAPYDAGEALTLTLRITSDAAQPAALRELAIRALERHPSPTTTRLLLGIMQNDPTVQVVLRGPNSPEDLRYDYPLRRAAREVLAEFVGMPGIPDAVI